VGVERVVTEAVGVRLGPRARHESLTRVSGGTTEWRAREGSPHSRVWATGCPARPVRTTCWEAAVAVAHSILVIAYQLLKDGRSYRDLGADFFDRRNHDSLERQLVRRLEALGTLAGRNRHRRSSGRRGSCQTVVSRRADDRAQWRGAPAGPRDVTATTGHEYGGLRAAEAARTREENRRSE
jgi:hypothetical protein